MDSKPEINCMDLQHEMVDYQQPGRLKSIWQLTNTLIPFFVLWYLAHVTLSYSYWLALPIVVLLGGFLVRIFIIFHDCGHGSFFRSRKANEFWGMFTGMLTFTPFHRWRASHNRHHGTSGNLDKRGEGDVWLMTLSEYLRAPRLERIKYRIYRNPVMMFLFGPLLITFVSNRFVGKGAGRTDKLSVYGTNAAIAIASTAIILLAGWKTFVGIHLLALFLAHVVGVWIFYVQHQYEGVYWRRSPDWDFVTAALEGASFYDLPAIMRWFSGNIGYHHIHHLNPRIPNYNLARCQMTIPILRRTKTITLLSSLSSMAFRLWDEESGKLISFRGVREMRRESAKQ